MSSECFLSRCGLVPGHILMIGLNAHLCILAKMVEDGTLDGITTAVFLAQNFARGLADEMIPVSMYMVYLRVGCILHNIVLGFVKMGQIVHEECVSLPTNLRNYAPFISLLAQQRRHQEFQLQWTWLLLHQDLHLLF